MRRRCPLCELAVGTLVAAALVVAVVRATEPDDAPAAAPAERAAAPGHGLYVPYVEPPPPVPRARLRAAIDLRQQLEHRLAWHGRKVRTLRRQLRLLRAELRQTRHVQARPARDVDYWAARQIAAAEQIAAESSGDPWPNCPDPYDGSGASWQQTVDCENGGSWYDSPGWYRCGLQFMPSWEDRFGRLCP